MKQIATNTFEGVNGGDATLAGLEMCSRGAIRDEFHLNSFVNLREGKYNKNYVPGNYTDDRADTQAIIKLLSSNDAFTKENVLQYIIKEYTNDFIKKLYPRAGYGAIKDFFGGSLEIDDIRRSQSKREDPGNAAIMRCLPLVFVDTTLADRYCDIITDVTHPHPLAREATRIIVSSVRHFLLEGGSHESIMDKAIETSNLLSTQLKQVDTLPRPSALQNSHYEVLCGPQPVPYMKSKGYEMFGMPGTVTYTTSSILYLLKHCTSPLEGLKQSAYMGGDVDSLGAIVLGTLCGKYGKDGLPEFLLKNTEGINRVAGLTEKFIEKVGK